MKLYSTLDRGIVEIKPLIDNTISIYSCGPTVYYRMHIGNIRAYVNWDILHRSLLYLGYDVKRVMNFTDVGHMTSDEDFGEDKLEKSASSEGVEPMEIANKYILTVLQDFSKMNILAPSGEKVDPKIDISLVEEYGFLRATSYVDEMIEIIKRIEANGYAYETDQAVYFDVTKLPEYTMFTGQSLSEKSEGVRDDVNVDSDKRNPADFVLWMKEVGRYANHTMHWSSPWGEGFPGWHIECSAMGTKALGNEFDIHTGGIDHIPVHHPNERAQNIGIFGHDAVKYWVHNEWLVNTNDDKLSKSAGNASNLPDVINAGFDALDVRYLFVSVNYRTKLKFSNEALEGARNARLNLMSRMRNLGNTQGEILPEYIERFKSTLENNLNISDSLALVNELLKSDEKKEDILATVLDFDKVFGLDIDSVLNEESENEEVSEDVQSLLDQRKTARENKNFAESDRLREEILKLGYTVLDTSEGQTLERK